MLELLLIFGFIVGFKLNLGFIIFKARNFPDGVGGLTYPKLRRHMVDSLELTRFVSCRHLKPPNIIANTLILLIRCTIRWDEAWWHNTDICRILLGDVSE